MKLLVILCLFILGAAWHKCNAQSLKSGGKSQGKTCSPITILVKSKTLLEKGNWAFCTDLTVNKTSLPYSRLGGNLLRQYHGSIPIYGSFDLNTLFSLECGAYLGIVANRAEALGQVPLPSDIDTSFDLGFDFGLVPGLSIDLENFGRLRLRYNYGLSNLLSVDERVIKTRRLDLGVNFRF